MSALLLTAWFMVNSCAHPPEILCAAAIELSVSPGTIV
jgi:hypothetical protein